MLATTAFNLLSAAGYECNIRAKLQVVRRHYAKWRAEMRRRESLELQAAMESAGAVIDRADHTWQVALQAAEVNRQAAEDAYVEAASQAAIRAASEWLETKDGQSYVKRQLLIAAQHIKLDMQTGKLGKPKDAKKEAMQRVHDAFCKEKETEAKRLAIDAFRAKTPPYSHESGILKPKRKSTPHSLR